MGLSACVAFAAGGLLVVVTGLRIVEEKAWRGESERADDLRRYILKSGNAPGCARDGGADRQGQAHFRDGAGKPATFPILP